MAKKEGIRDLATGTKVISILREEKKVTQVRATAAIAAYLNNELDALKLLADDLLALTESQISEAVSNGSLLVVTNET